MRLQAAAQQHAALSSIHKGVGSVMHEGDPLGCKAILQPHQDEVYGDASAAEAYFKDCL